MSLGKSRSEVSTMKLINVTNSHSRLVMSQLESTDAELVKVYTAGDTLVIYTLAPSHVEILLYNNKRKIRHSEISINPSESKTLISFSLKLFSGNFWIK